MNYANPSQIIKQESAVLCGFLEEEEAIVGKGD